MGRIHPPKSVEVLIDGTWQPGKVRTCEPVVETCTCTAVVTWNPEEGKIATGRFPKEAIRDPLGGPHPCYPESLTGCGKSVMAQGT